MTTPNRVLVVGAASRNAGLVALELAKRGVTVRALVRGEDEASRARANGATEVAPGDLRDPASLAAACEGVDGVFHVGPAFLADEDRLGLNLVEAATHAKVRKFVFSAVIRTSNLRLPNHTVKQPVETALFASPLEYTILQPTTFFQNIEPAWPAVLRDGVFAEPFSRHRRMSRVDYRDVAEVAALAFASDRLAYGSFELCSDDAPDREDIAAEMSRVLGRPVHAAEPSFEAWAAIAAPPYSPERLALLAQVFAFFDECGSMGNGLVLRTILGRKPRGLREYLEDLAAGTPTSARGT